MPSMISTPVAVAERLPHRLGQVLARRHRLPQRRDGLARGEHRLVRRGRGEADRHTVLVDQVGELDRRRLLDQQRRGAGMQGEQQDAAEPEGERVRRGAREHVVGRRLQHVPGERLADRHHVAVEVHRRLRATGGAGGEGEHADVVAGGPHVVERRVLGRQPLRPGVVAEGDHRDAERLDRLEEAVVDEGRVEVGDLVDGLQLTRAQQRHGGDQDGAGLQHAEPRRGQPLVVGPAQEHPVARHDAEVLDEDVSDPVRGRDQLGVRPRRLARLVQARPVRTVAGSGVVQQGGRTVEAVGVLQLGQVEGQLGPLLGRREMVTAERVDVGRREQLHGRQGMPPL